MPSTRTIQTSFSAGEVSPQLIGRVDLRDYRNGAATLRNMISKPTGAVRSRPGLRFVADAYGQGPTQPVRLIEFVYTNGDAYVIEIGARAVGSSPSYFRLHRGDVPVMWGEVVSVGPVNAAFEDGGTTIVLQRRHNLLENDIVYVTVGNEFGTGLPPGLSTTTGYYVRQVDGYRFQLATVASGPPVTATIDPLNAELLFVVKLGALPLYPAAGVALVLGQVYWAAALPRSAAVHVHTAGLATANPFTDPKVDEQPIDGVLTIGGPYQPADIFKLNYTQSYDVLTFTRNGYPPHELRREGVNPDRWVAQQLILAPPRAPTGLAFSDVRRGTPSLIDGWGGSVGSGPGRLQVRTLGAHLVALGSVVFIFGASLTGGPALPDGYYVAMPPDTSILGGDAARMMQLRYLDTGQFVLATTGTSGLGSGELYYIDAASQLEHEYRVSAVYEQQAESEPSRPSLVIPESVGLSLDSPTATVTLTWDTVTEAIAYRLYKKSLSGLFGFIAEIQAPDTTFVDVNLGPDLEAMPPEMDDDVPVGAAFDPQAVAYFEQRRVFASPSNAPQRLWLTNSGTENQFTYTIPIREDDRISVEFRSLQAQAVRHVIPIGELLVFTTTGEWRVTSINSDALTPLNISARPQSTNGSTFVVPVVMNDRVVYAAARGGHLRELRFQWQSQGFAGQDLSFRAQHLFDDFAIVDMTRMQSPTPIIWIVSSSGALLGMSYVPDEEIVGFHRHDTDRGTFESVACVPELVEDAVYVTVTRDGLRTIESMRIREHVPADKQPCADLHTTTVDTVFVHGNPGFLRAEVAAMVTSDGSTLATGPRAIGSVVDVRFLSLFPSLALNAAAAPENVGDLLVVRALRDPRVWYRLLVTQVVAGSWVRAEALDFIPENVVTGDLEFDYATARRSVHPALEGHTVAVVADGVASTAVVTDGAVVLAEPAFFVTVGLPYVPELRTLPLVAQADGAGHGRMKNLNRVWLRLFEVATGAVAGPDDASLVPIEGLPLNEQGAVDALTQTMLRTTVLPSWTEDGQIIVRQTLPFPLTVLGMVLEAEFGD